MIVNDGVTRQDIECSTRKDSSDCALAQSLKRLGYQTVAVDTERVWLAGKTSYESALIADLPPELSQWISRYDRGNAVDPIEFSLEFHTDDGTVRCETLGCKGRFVRGKWPHNHLCDDCRAEKYICKTDERNAEIVRLRRDERLSISVLGERYNISRQRIQQIVGKTGHIAVRRMKQKQGTA